MYQQQHRQEQEQATSGLEVDGMADSKKYDGSQWLHSLRKLTTATDTLTTLPADLYADGNNATVGLVGNMSQSGTPTPQNPIQPQETGERTENLFDIGSVTHQSVSSDGTISYSSGMDLSGLIKVNGNYTVSWTTGRNGAYMRVSTYDDNMTFIERVTTVNGYTNSQYSNSHSGYIRINYENGFELTNIMFNLGSTALPYQPYGYKIPISSASTTTPVYLGEVQTTRKIKQLVLTGEESAWSGTDTQYWQLLLSDTAVYNGGLFCTHFSDVRFQSTGERIRFYVDKTVYDTVTVWKTYLAQQYANGTPVCVWYVLATETTGIVNEPLRKIGDYADTVSGITIPTITGADSFDVLTTLKPSEVELTYTGWHDANVQEWDGSQWNE